MLKTPFSYEKKLGSNCIMNIFHLKTFTLIITIGAMNSPTAITV